MIKELYELVIKEILTPNYIYPRISHLANCMINKHNHVMSLNEIAQTYNEINSDGLGNDIKKYLDSNQINHLLQMLKNLSKFKRNER